MESTTMEKAIVSNESTSLKGGLKSRHLSMISIAGVIGGALFVGSGKVIAIVIFLIVGSLAVMHLWPWGVAAGMTHLTDQGFMPNGFSAVVTALLGAMFAFIGAEIVTVAAAESENPSKEIVKTTKSVVLRWSN